MSIFFITNPPPYLALNGEFVFKHKAADFAKEHPVFNDEACHFPILKGLGLLLQLGLVIVTIIFTAPIGLYFIPAVALGVIIAASSLWKHLLYETTLILNRITVGKENWMHVVHEAGVAKLYLGALPLQDYDHVREFKEKNITEVVSLIEPFEQNSKTFGGTPVSQKDWEEANIVQTSIAAEDYEPVPKEKLGRAARIIHNALESGKNIYVHCKGGKGRSVQAVICTLLQHYPEVMGISVDAEIGPAEVEKAINYLQNIRPQIHLNNNQKEVVSEYFKCA